MVILNSLLRPIQIQLFYDFKAHICVKAVLKHELSAFIFNSEKYVPSLFVL